MKDYSTKGDPARKPRLQEQWTKDARGMLEDLAAEIDEIAEKETEAAVEFIEDQERAADRPDYAVTPAQLAWLSVLYNRHVDRGGMGEQVYRDLERQGLLPKHWEGRI